MSKEAKLELVAKERRYCREQLAEIEKAIRNRSHSLEDCKAWFDMICVQIDAVEALERRALAEKSKKIL
jgi:hypothetical protein